jgi:exosortase/archaeosortase family protein
MLLPYKKFLWFVAKFLLLFGICYYGTLAVIGLAEPGGYYSPFIEKHLDYVSWIKRAIIAAVGGLLGLFNIDTITEPGYLIRMVNQRGVIIAMDCVGYGVYSFWIAYILTNSGGFGQKTLWLILGLLLLWFINVIRISLFLVSINTNRSMPLGLDHHSLFTIFAYGAIFIMIWLYEKKVDRLGDKEVN